MKTASDIIIFPVDHENRQLTARKLPTGWQLVERCTIEPNSARYLDVDNDMAADLDRILAKSL